MDASITPDTDGNAPFSILIVDDEYNNLQILGNVLREYGYLIEFATNGKDALEWIRRQSFDLVLLDVMMPQMDGFEVCQRLKNDPATSNTPVIFLTVKDDIESVAKGFKIGSVDYITKPFHSIELLARVKTHLALGRFGRVLESKNKELESKNQALRQALEELNTLRGIIPICANCHKIRDDQGCWEQMEAYIQNHSDAKFSHSICPDCVKTLYENEEWYEKTKAKREVSAVPNHSET